MAFGLALASSHSPRDGVWLGTSWPAGLGLVRVVNPWFFLAITCVGALWLWVKGTVMVNRLLSVGCGQEPLQQKADFSGQVIPAAETGLARDANPSLTAAPAICTTTSSASHPTVEALALVARLAIEIIGSDSGAEGA